MVRPRATIPISPASWWRRASIPSASTPTLWFVPGWLWRHWRPPRRRNWIFLLLDPRGQELLAAPAALGFAIGARLRHRRPRSPHGRASAGSIPPGPGNPPTPTWRWLAGMDQHQDQPKGPPAPGPGNRPCRSSARWGPQFHAHLNTELGAGHLLGLLSARMISRCIWDPPGIAPGPLVGQTGSGLIRATAAGSGQTPEENGVGAAANDAENGQTHAKWTVGEAHRRLPEMCSRPPWRLS